MKLSRVFEGALAVVCVVVVGRSVYAAEATENSCRTFAAETYALRSLNHLNRMADTNGVPYFHILWDVSAEARHAGGIDGPDVISRMWQATVMARHLTGQTCRNEAVYAHVLQDTYLDSETGQPVKETGFLGFAQCVALEALVTAYADSRDPCLRETIIRMVDHMPEAYHPRSFQAVPIKALMNCARVLNYKPAADQAGKLVRECGLLSVGTKHFGGHMHGNLRTLQGAADYALYIGDQALFDHIDALYRDVRSYSGASFGFLPEVAFQHDDRVGCETCALMDYVALATTLANNGYPEYWGDIERTMRNQLAESQLVDGSWLKPTNKADTLQSSFRDIGERMVGGFAGWSSPTHLLAYAETGMGTGKTRAFQNCCAGSGLHAFFIAWKNAARFDKETLQVNLHIDKLLPQAEIRCYQPYQGRLTIALKKACSVRIRIPDFTPVEELRAKGKNGTIAIKVKGLYADLGPHAAGETVEVTYPLPLREENVSIGNPGRLHFSYCVLWKGDTVIRMTPIGEPPKEIYSEGEKGMIPAFYGEEGPGRLYLREGMLKDVSPALTPLSLDDGSDTLNFCLLNK